MVFIEAREVIMPATVDPDKRDLPGVEALKRFTMPDGDQPVLCAMYYIGMTIYFWDPLVSTKVIL